MTGCMKAGGVICVNQGEEKYNKECWKTGHAFER
jgi:hypothetical protein